MTTNKIEIVHLEDSTSLTGIIYFIYKEEEMTLVKIHLVILYK